MTDETAKPGRGAYRLEDGTFVRTQGEIPKGQPVNKIMIPVDSKGLVDFINRLVLAGPASFDTRMKHAKPVLPDDTSGELDETPIQLLTVKEPAAPKTDEALLRRKLVEQMRGLETEAIEERILTSKGPVFARYLLAGIEQLGALGKDGWDHVHAFLELHRANVTVMDRGLHLLALMQIAEIDRPKPPPRTYKELQG